MTAIIIGRFQVPYLHVGHLHLIATALRECDKVSIFLGTSMDIDSRNPYNRAERIRMIKRIFPQVEIQILLDHPSDEQWSKNVDLVGTIYENPILYHSRDSFKDYYKGKLPLREVEEIPGFSGTKLREEVKKYSGYGD